ncbi:SMC-Scp complex subunit ScpB [Dyella sp.]|jgi:segregation and condensation protein B|uniref:SMC-Scp complex subunit ScpB n=1 Tax=Dyella sp. TaxID=1869338 RepID=UPI002D79BEFB|nr:SMC-Scp complex subunit ScpB [Dyella sp.]HET6432377.1 SMC-Scp complex subunit ScpB [Dyella sp.]
MSDVEQNDAALETAAPARAPLQPAQLKPIIEAALLASSHPMTVQQLAELFGEEDEVAREQIARALESLAEDCAGRGVELKEVASGFRYQVRQDVHPWLSRLWTERPSRYSRALLETLALIAYRQPITRPEIEQIRGVVVSSNIIKTMEERDWIRVVGHRDVPGRPALFGTTRAFLDYFNLKSLDELPPLSEIRDMEDPQLRFEADPLPARIVRDLPIDPEAEAGEPSEAAATDAHETMGSATTGSTEHAAEASDTASGQSSDDSEAIPAGDAETTSSGPAAPMAPEAGIHTADEAANPAAADDGADEKHS